MKYYLGILLCGLASLQARELEVDPGGRGTYSSLLEAGAAAQPGDVIKLKPSDSPYRASVVIRGLRGTPEKPIVVDGQGSTLLGTDPLQSSEWESMGNGLFRNARLAPTMKIKENDLQRFFFVFDGRIQRMGRISKAARPPFVEPAKLQPGEWTYVEATQEFYVRVADNASLDSGHIEMPTRDAGVVLADGCTNVIVRNFTCRNFLNDGFNIHGKCTGLVFEKIRAYDCGDDGFSEHEDCESRISDYQAGGNATGICNVNRAVCVAENVVFDHNAGYEIYLTDSTQLQLRRAVIRTQAKRSLVLRGSEKDPANCRLVWEDSLMVADGPAAKPIEILERSELKADRINVIGFPWRVEGLAEVAHSNLIAPRATLDVTPKGTWKGTDNLYDINWPKAEDRDANSLWKKLDPAEIKKLETPPFGR